MLNRVCEPTLKELIFPSLTSFMSVGRDIPSCLATLVGLRPSEWKRL